MYTITYSSKRFGYDDLKITVNSFTDEVLDNSKNFIDEILEEFQIQNNTINAKNQSEYIYELLMLGTLWRMYDNKAVSYEKTPPKFLSKIFSPTNKKISPKKLEYNKKNLDKLFHWLESTGEFKRELKHLKIWKEFLKFQKPQKLMEYLRKIIIFADWFKTSSKYIIGSYSSNERNFLYYLRLMGSEISNRS
ncbi:MAG: hypothetical protein LLF83_00990 [Methanobacterium sp.]|nr:hypothetical protein [Methanobacterium sp.]